MITTVLFLLCYIISMPWHQLPCPCKHAMYTHSQVQAPADTACIHSAMLCMVMITTVPYPFGRPPEWTSTSALFGPLSFTPQALSFVTPSPHATTAAPPDVPVKGQGKLTECYSKTANFVYMQLTTTQLLHPTSNGSFMLAGPLKHRICSVFIVHAHTNSAVPKAPFGKHYHPCMSCA